MHSKEEVNVFIHLCNQSLGLEDGRRLNQNHLQRLSKQFRLFPIAFLNVFDIEDRLKHWTLVIGKTPDGIEIYDPKLGLQKIELKDEKIHYFPEKGRRQNVLPDDYKLPRERLEQLGILQEKDMKNCGQLCVFAAKYAKGI